MGKVIGFDGKPILTEDKEPETLEIPAGDNIKLIGSCKDNVLRNERMLPKVPVEQRRNMLDYNKRYSIAQGIDIILRRIEEDDELKHLRNEPIAVVIYPQQVTHDNIYDQDKLTTTMELGTLVKAKVQSDTTIEIQ